MAQRSGHAGDQGHGQRLPGRERRDARQQHAQSATRRQAGQPARPGEAGADVRRHRLARAVPVDQVLHQHAGLHHHGQKEHQECVAPLPAAKVQQHQRRHVRQPVHAHHDAPLHLGAALQKTLRIVAQRAQHRQQQKHVHRDEHGEQVEVARAHQPILNRQHDEEGQHQRAVIAAPRGRQRHELAQRKEGHEGEQHRGRRFAQRPGEPEHQRHEPRMAQQHARVRQVIGAIRRPVAALAQRQRHQHAGGQRQHAKHQQEQRGDLLVGR